MFSTIEEFETLLGQNQEKALSELVALEKSLRAAGAPKDHQAAHDKWQLVIAADRAYHTKANGSVIEEVEAEEDEET